MRDVTVTVVWLLYDVSDVELNDDVEDGTVVI